MPMLLQTALILVLALHLLCVNLACAGPIVCLWFERRERLGCKTAGKAGRYLAMTSVWALLLGMVLGIVVGWLTWSTTYHQVLKVPLHERVGPMTA